MLLTWSLLHCYRERSGYTVIGPRFKSQACYFLSLLICKSTHFFFSICEDEGSWQCVLKGREEKKTIRLD